MAVCSFIGHRDVYDADIENRLQEAVDQIVEESDSVDFLLELGGDFFKYCLLTILKAKARSTKEIHICLIVTKYQYEAINNKALGSIPACMFDTLYIRHKDDNKRVDVHGTQKMLLRLTQQSSTHIISYLYGGFYSTEIGIFDLNRFGPDVKIISVTSEETERAIMKCAEQLPDRERLALEKWKDDLTLMKIGVALGLSRERGRQLLQHGSRNIRDKLKHRCNPILGRRKFSVGVFALGEKTYNAMKYFQQIISFLISEYHVRHAYIDGVYATSSLMTALKEWPGSIYNLHVTAVTAEETGSQDSDDADLRKKYCPPCDAVMNVGLLHMENEMRDLSSIAAIMEQCDFCVFNFSAMSHVEKLRRNYIHNGCIVLVDIGKTGYIKAN